MELHCTLPENLVKPDRPGTCRAEATAEFKKYTYIRCIVQILDIVPYVTRYHHLRSRYLGTVSYFRSVHYSKLRVRSTSYYMYWINTIFDHLDDILFAAAVMKLHVQAISSSDPTVGDLFAFISLLADMLRL